MDAAGVDVEVWGADADEAPTAVPSFQLIRLSNRIPMPSCAGITNDANALPTEKMKTKKKCRERNTDENQSIDEQRELQTQPRSANQVRKRHAECTSNGVA
jgi:hypothetical protein